MQVFGKDSILHLGGVETADSREAWAADTNMEVHPSFLMLWPQLASCMYPVRRGTNGPVSITLLSLSLFPFPDLSQSLSSTHLGWSSLWLPVSSSYTSAGSSKGGCLDVTFNEHA